MNLALLEKFFRFYFQSILNHCYFALRASSLKLCHLQLLLLIVVLENSRLIESDIVRVVSSMLRSSGSSRLHNSLIHKFLVQT